MIDPHARQRVVTVSLRQTVEENLTNMELLAAFERATRGNLSELDKYLGAIRDAIRYSRDPKTGRETPVREWTKQALWAYLEYVENNYCAAFRVLTFQKEREDPDATCRQRVWIGLKPASEAVQAHCLECPAFQRPMVRHRIKALSKWYAWLSHVEAVPHNVMADLKAGWHTYHRKEGGAGERRAGTRRRNPTTEEVRRLVNETAHPQRRAFYAIGAKNWFRPNEMFMLDRYASFGIPVPEGLPMPAGFANGFAVHPEARGFHEGGEMIYLPETKGDFDKRKGNRWGVVDGELRPIVEQHLAWWDRHVARDHEGRPKHSCMWLNEAGMPLKQSEMYPGLFYEDCERLGLMRAPQGPHDKGERLDPLRAWTAHCMRHYGQRLSQTLKFPDAWNHHFRGDKLGDARDHYYLPDPLEVRKMYLELVPRLGLLPLAEAPRLRGGTGGERDAHRAILTTAREQARQLRKGGASLRCVRIVTDAEGAEEAWVVPQKVAPSVVAALRAARPGVSPRVEADPEQGPRGRWMNTASLEDLYGRALAMLA